MHSVIHIVFACIIALCPAFAAESARPFVVNGPRTESVPLQLVHAQLSVRVEVEGRELRLAIDTGADHSLLDTKLAAVLPVNLQAARPGYGVDGAAVERRVARVALKLGRMAVTGYAMAFVDLTAMNASLAEDGLPPIDGLLGADLLSVLRARIDYGDKALLLRLPQRSDKAEAAPRSATPSAAQESRRP